MSIKDRLLQELNNIKSQTSTMTFAELEDRMTKINRIENLLTTMSSIENVIKNRIKRGATEANIQNYKKHLIQNTWRNNDIIKEFIMSL